MPKPTDPQDRLEKFLEKQFSLLHHDLAALRADIHALSAKLEAHIEQEDAPEPQLLPRVSARG